MRLKVGLWFLVALLTGEVRLAAQAPAALVIAEIQDHLGHANVLKHGQVQVSFADGIATLTGTVESIGVKMDAERAAWKDEDVHRVTNQLVVVKAGVDPKQIASEARRRILNYYANSIFDNIVVDAQGDTLILQGQVTQPYKKDAVGNYLAHIRGVAAVENKIQVLQLSAQDEDLRVRIARAIYDDPSFESYTEMANPPIHIIVDGGRVTLVGSVNSELDRARAEQNAQYFVPYATIQNNLQVVGRGTTP
jgi:hyperosmotically inducible protein